MPTCHDDEPQEQLGVENEIDRLREDIERLREVVKSFLIVCSCTSPHMNTVRSDARAALKKSQEVT